MPELKKAAPLRAGAADQDGSGIRYAKREPDKPPCRLAGNEIVMRGWGVSPTKVFPHNLRHLFARTFYGIEKDIAKLADILGHASINTTRIYIVTTGEEHKRKLEHMRLVV